MKPARKELFQGGERLAQRRGIKGGQIVGSTTADGGEPKNRRLGPGDLPATIYRVPGIHPETAPPDRQGSSVRRVDSGRPVAELC